MLDEAKTLDALALELLASDRDGDAGKSTRVLEQERASGSSPELNLPSAANAAESDRGINPTERLRVALETAIQRGERVWRSIASSDAKTVAEALRRLGEASGSGPLALVDNASLSQLLRLAEALVTMLESGKGEALPAQLRGELESRIGGDLGDLRIHKDEAAAEAADRHGAVAFAQGTDVYFASGKYDPSSPAGKHLIAHEATHVAQQRAGGSPSAAGAMSAPGSAVEREADRVADAFAAGLAPGAAEFAVSERAAVGTISRKDTAAAPEGTVNGAPTAPKEWKINLLGQVLDLSAQLAGATDVGGGEKQININRSIGPLKIESAKFTASADKISSGTLTASIDSGSFKGTSGSLTVDSSGNVSGTLQVPINVPGLFVKQVSVTVGAGTITGKATLSPSDFAGPDFPIKTSDFELTVTSTSGSISVGLTGSAEVGIDNGMAQGQAKMAVDLKADSSGVSFTATITGKIDIAGIAAADAVLTYDGKTVVMTAGATIPVEIPGLQGTANIKYDKGKLSLESKDLHFTLPQLAPVKFDEVMATQSKLQAKLHLASPLNIPIPGPASLTLDQSSISIDGKNVSGDITGTFKLNNAEGLTGQVKLAYETGGDITGSIDITGGAKFTVGGIEISIDSASKLQIAKGLGVSGDVAGSIKIAGLPVIAVHVVAQQGQPIDLTCDANIPLNQISPQLGGNIHVQYHRGGGANAFSFEATNISVAAAPVNGQVLFSSFTGHLQGKELTGSLTAQAGTVIKAGGATVTIDGGTIQLQPGRILNGKLQAHTEMAGNSVEAKVGWTNGKFDWDAEGTFDLGSLTSSMVLGTVRAKAGSNGVGEFEAVGEVHFANEPLAGITITKISGNRADASFQLQINAEQAINKAATQLPNVGFTATNAVATVNYNNSQLVIQGGIEGHAKYPKDGSKLEGDVHLTLGRGGFTGKIDNLQIKASEYFHSQGGSADIASGIVSLGTGTFEIPNVVKGNIVRFDINLKEANHFNIEVDADAVSPALAGMKIKIIADNTSVHGELRESTQPIQLGKFATLTVGGGSSVQLTGGQLTAHVNGAVDAHGLGTGTFNFDYSNGQASGSARVDVKPFAMFDATVLDLRISGDRKISTNSDVVLKLAGQYATHVDAMATIGVSENTVHVVGKITRLKDLGKVSEAFKYADITWHQDTQQVTVDTEFDVGGTVIPELATGSILKLSFANSVFSVMGTLKPANFGPITFSADSHITASWHSNLGRFVVEGAAHAEIAEIGTADFTVDSALGGGAPGSFGLKGHIDPTKLSQTFPGITFSNVSSDFSIVIGGGARPELGFHFGAAITGIPAAGVSDMQANVDANYKSREGLSGTVTITRAKLGEVIANGSLQLAKNKFQAGTLHLEADLPSLKIEGTATVSASDMGALSTSAELKVTPGGGSALAKFVESGSIHVDVQRWKLQQANGQLHLKPPEFLPIENTVVEVGYAPGPGLHATLSTSFAAPMAKHGEKGTFVAGYERDRGLFAHIEFPVTVPGFQAATVAGDLDSKGIKVGATLIPKDASIIKQANIDIGYELDSGLFIQGSITLKPSEELELVVGLRYDAKGGLQVLGITPHDKNATPEDHEIAKWHKDFPTIPLATIGVASLGLKFGMGVAAGYRMPRIAFKNPQLEGGLDALDKGGMPAFTFGGQIAMGAYIQLSLSVQVAGEIQLLIATCSAGIGAEIAARLNLDLGADVNGRFAPGQGALLTIDPFVGASLDLVASLIATLHASVCWFTIVDKKWTLASTNFAHIELGQFHPFNPVGLQIGGPGGSHLTNGLSLRDDAFDQIKEGVKQGAVNAGNEEANEDAKKRVAPVLKAFKNASHQFEQLPGGWEKGMTTAPVDFHSMFPVSDDEWNFYQDHADNAEQIDPADAPHTPTERLAKAVGVTARKDPGGAGRLILAWRRAQIANKGINPDTGVNVVQEREEVQKHINAQYQAALLAAQEKQKQQDLEHAEHVKKQTADYQTAQTKHTETAVQQKKAHETTVAKTQNEWNAAQKKKATAAQNAKKEGVQVQAKTEEKAPPPPIPAEPAAPAALAKPAPIPVLPKVPLPAPPEQLPAVTLPALPSDPGVSVHAASAIPPVEKKVQPQSPGAKQAPGGGTPDPMPGTSSTAQQVGGGGGAPQKAGAAGPGGSPAGGGATGAAPRPGPAVTAGPDGIISQQKTLDAKEKQLEALDGGGATPGAAGKPGVLGKLGGAPTAGAPAPANSNAPAGKTAPGATPAAAAPKGGDGGIDPTVQKVIDQGKTDEVAYKQKLGQQDQQYGAKVTEDDKKTEDQAKQLDVKAEEEKKRKEREKAEAAAKAAAAKTDDGKPKLGPDGKPLADKDKKPRSPIGTRVPLDVDGESHTLYIDDASSVAMVASTPTPVTAKVSELGGTIAAAKSIQPLAASELKAAQADAQPLANLVAKAKTTDAAGDAANSQVTAAQQALAGPLKITWRWAKVSALPAVTGGSIENPLLHPYYPDFKARVQRLSTDGHISVDPGPYAQDIWTKICNAVKAAAPQMNDPAAYSNFAKGWLNMKSPEFQKAIQQFEALGREMAKAGSAGFARARNFGFWSKDEGRSLSEAVSDLTLETSAIGGLMDGLPTLDGKKAGWDPEIWGALSNAYANAVVPELLKGKKINVCVGAGVAAGNIWEAVESVALAKGLKGTKITLESVTTNYAAAAKTKDNRRVLDDSKHTNGIKGCLFVGDRGGAVAAADAHFKTLTDAPATATPAAVNATKVDPNQPATAKPLPPGAPIGTRVPMTIGKDGHTQYIDPSGKPMVASTPTPVTDKLAELRAKLNSLPSSDPKRAEASAEITKAQALEHKVAELAQQIKNGTAVGADASAQLNTQQQTLAVSVAKIWEIADPGAMDAAKAKEAIDARATDCAEISEPLAKDWVGKTRAQLESQFLDAGSMRHAVIEKFLASAEPLAGTKKVGSKDPIAVQKFQDIEAEAHIDPAHGDLKTEFFKRLKDKMVEPAFTDRERTYPVMKTLNGDYKFSGKGVKVPVARITPYAVRNQSVDTLYWNANGFKASQIDDQIKKSMPGASPVKLQRATADVELRKKAYRHLLKSANPLTTIDKSKPIASYATWYGPGTITLDTSASPDKEFARMMTLGALQPEWYPQGTIVLHITHKAEAAARTLLKPTAFDGLMSSLWCARNLGEADYGITGGGLGEFLEANVPFADVTSAEAIIPSDDFLADIQRVSSEVKEKLGDTSTPTEELIRGKTQNTKILNTAGQNNGGAKDMFDQVIDRSTKEQQHPQQHQPSAPGAVVVESSLKPTAPAAAPGGGFDTKTDKDKNQDLKADAVADKVDDLTHHFNMAGEDHTFSVKEDGGKPTVLMASGNPQELATKQKAFKDLHAAYDAFCNANAGSDDTIQFFIDMAKMTEAVNAKLDELKAMTSGDLFKAATSDKKRSPAEVESRRRERMTTALKEAATELLALAAKYKLPDLTPLGVEQANQLDWENKFLKPVQVKIQAILASGKDALAEFLPGAKIGYTGSLASGWKGPHKVPLDAAALRFNPASFDCDAYIELSDAMWKAEIAPVYSKQTKSGKPDEAPFLSALVAWGKYGKVEAIRKKMVAQLNKIPEYKKELEGKGPNADFTFRIRSANVTAELEQRGNVYQNGAMSKAGMPETEAARRDAGFTGTAFVPANHGPVDKQTNPPDQPSPGGTRMPNPQKTV